MREKKKPTHINTITKKYDACKQFPHPRRMRKNYEMVGMHDAIPFIFFFYFFFNKLQINDYKLRLIIAL